MGESQPLVVAFEDGYGPAMFNILRESADVVTIDGIELSEFDQLDIGETGPGDANAPVVVKIMGVPRSGWILSAV